MSKREVGGVVEISGMGGCGVATLDDWRLCMQPSQGYCNQTRNWYENRRVLGTDNYAVVMSTQH